MDNEASHFGAQRGRDPRRRGAHRAVPAEREGDICEMFACRPEGMDVLVRAAQDRVLADGGGKLCQSAFKVDP